MERSVDREAVGTEDELIEVRSVNTDETMEPSDEVSVELRLVYELSVGVELGEWRVEEELLKMVKRDRPGSPSVVKVKYDVEK